MLQWLCLYPSKGVDSIWEQQGLESEHESSDDTSQPYDTGKATDLIFQFPSPRTKDVFLGSLGDLG